MASPAMCPRCLRRSLRIEISSVGIRASPKSASFSSSANLAQPAKAAPKQASKQQAFQIKRKTKAGPVVTRISASDRRALRKRVVLSNTNALPVHGLRILDATNVDALRAAEGNVVGFGNDTVDVLRALEAFKPTQGWSMFQRPATVVRPETVRLAGLMKRAEREESTAEKTTRMLFHGERGSGKSVLQLQAMATAQLKGWVLINIPEARDMTDATTSFKPSKGKDGTTTYIQPEYTANLLGSILKANDKVLSTIKLAHKHQFVIPVPDNISLSRLLDIGARDQELAYPIWQAFLKEITTKSQQDNGLQRPPILLTIDSFANLMVESQYVDQNLKKIHALELALASDLCALLNGTSEMHNGGIVLASTSETSNHPKTPTLDFLLTKAAARDQGLAEPQWNPFVVRDSRVEDALRGVELVKVGGISKDEAKGLMEYYALSGLLRDSVTDSLVGEKWAVSGGGIIGAIERVCVLQRI